MCARRRQINTATLALHTLLPLAEVDGLKDKFCSGGVLTRVTHMIARFSASKLRCAADPSALD